MPRPMVSTPVPAYAVLWSQVKGRPQRARGQAMATLKVAMPRIDPAPKRAMYINPAATEGMACRASTINTADPAMPCMMPIRKARSRSPPRRFTDVAMVVVPVVIQVLIMAMSMKMNDAAVMTVNMEMNALADHANQHVGAQPDQHHPDGQFQV